MSASPVVSGGLVKARPFGNSRGDGMWPWVKTQLDWGETVWDGTLLCPWQRVSIAAVAGQAVSLPTAPLL